jgi:hypothetical protein
MATLTNIKHSNKNKQLNRFAVVKLWPEIKTAEDECIARLKIAANLLNIECLEVDSAGYFIKDPSNRATKENVDFVIHLHFDTPKNYDAFSFVALWNPLDFYFQWDYKRTTRNLLSHDDFISCDSADADDHINRIIKDEITHRSPFFKLHHSPPTIIHKPSLGELKLFYIGINWEKINKSKQRYQEVLKSLDNKNMLRIYGPKIFQGVNVWKGYNGYVKELPFDGISVVNEIHAAGICLVFSSKAHKKSALMSNRLFEAISAGALVICDENPFAKKYFGDCLLYINGRNHPEKIVAEINRHVNWATHNKLQALDLIKRSQEIFNKQFSLKKNLKKLYDQLEERKRILRTYPVEASISVSTFFLLPQYSKKGLKNHLASRSCQEYKNINAFLVLDKKIKKNDLDFITSEISRLNISIKIILKEFIIYTGKSVITHEKLGKIFYELFQDVNSSDAFMFIAPNESIISNHVYSLVSVLQSDNSFHSTSSGVLVLGKKHSTSKVNDNINFNSLRDLDPIGFGRFLFKKKNTHKDLIFLLPHLNYSAMLAFVGDHNHKQILPATLFIDNTKQYPDLVDKFDTSLEKHIIFDFFQKEIKMEGKFISTVDYDLNITGDWTWFKLFSHLLNPLWLFNQFLLLKTFGFKIRYRKFLVILHEIKNNTSKASKNE